MSKWQLYIIAHDGEDIAQKLMAWDDSEILELRLAAFAKDAVISIEPLTRPDSGRDTDVPSTELESEGQT